MPEPDDIVTVRYSAKELFAQINDKIDALTQRVEHKLDVVAEKLDAKADHEALVKLEGRVDELERKESERTAFGLGQKAILVALFAVLGLLIPTAVSVFFG